MTLLHPNMILQQTPLSNEVIRQYLCVELIILKGNVDFDNYMKKNQMNVDWYIENEDYNVIEINN